MRINTRRKHNQDELYRQNCRRRALYYEGLREPYRQWVDNLSVMEMYQLVGAVHVQDKEGMKEFILDQGLKQIEDSIEYWTAEAEQGLVDPNVYV